MIDRERRRRYAELVRHFAAGVLTVDEYEARTDDLAMEAQDPGIAAVWRTVWVLYDDFRTERLRGAWALDPATRRRIARCILFLYSDSEFCWPDERPRYATSCLASSAIHLVTLITFGLCRRLFTPYLRRRLQDHQRWMAQFGELECWPFLGRAEFEAALRKPTLLAARSAS